MKPFYGIGIDKLTLCYTINKNSILHNIGDEVEIDLGDFRLRKIESGHFKNSFHILSLWDAPDNKGLSWQIYGTLKFARYTDKEEMPTLAWLYFENSFLQYPKALDNLSYTHPLHFPHQEMEDLLPTCPALF